ncbi:hypothetical protein SP3_00047 [Bacillus phage fHSPT3]|nr:hypothetical protein MAWWA_132 [Bacillus phage vB_BspH_Mawwa]QXN70752.1 hypothetical protein TIMEGRIFFIN_133 [Bacillus phage vB_BspH_TimeGriffin]
MGDEYKKDKATFICSTPSHLTREAREKSLKEFKEKLEETLVGMQKVMERQKEISEDLDKQKEE